jgi:multimeric flavodoxin WrbA
MFIQIRGDNGWEECQSCAHCESDTCHSCDDADQYEPAG